MLTVFNICCSELCLISTKFWECSLFWAFWYFTWNCPMATFIIPIPMSLDFRDILLLWSVHPSETFLSITLWWVLYFVIKKCIDFQGHSQRSGQNHIGTVNKFINGLVLTFLMIFFTNLKHTCILFWGQFIYITIYLKVKCQRLLGQCAISMQSNWEHEWK